MKKAILSFIILSICFCVNAQMAKTDYEKVVGKFVEYYNNNKSIDVFDMFSVDMQKALPQSKTDEFVKGLKQQLGRIKQSDFDKFKTSLAFFTTQFDNGTFTLQISINEEMQINGLMIKPYIPNNIPVIERTSGKYCLPFNGDWYVVWGGDTEKLNYHVAVNAQKNAFDFLIIDKYEKTHTNDGSKNSDYYCFGRELIAPCDAEVVFAVDGVKDNVPGEMNLSFPFGNTVLLKTESNEYIYFCHFKQFSVAVRQGQKVNKGDLLGLCGNSGRSSEAHLHFHVQNIEGSNQATGVKCYFDNILVNEIVKNDYSPIQGETISNVD